jgi:hypothetical protein
MTFLFLLATLLGTAVHPSDGTREATRIRQTTLETLLSTRRALIRSNWQSLGQLDAQIKELSAPDAQAVVDGEIPGLERIGDMIRRESRRQFLETERMRTLQAMQDLTVEVASLQADLDKIKTSLDKSQQILDGHWVVTLMPMGTKGDFFISQNGTILTGNYQLENGQTGSVQGLFVNNYVLLERIDAKFGKMGRLEGPLSKDRVGCRGTWYSYDITSGQAVTGAFTLDKVQEDQAP